MLGFGYGSPGLRFCVQSESLGRLVCGARLKPTQCRSLWYAAELFAACANDNGFDRSFLAQLSECVLTGAEHHGSFDAHDV